MSDAPVPTTVTTEIKGDTLHISANSKLLDDDILKAITRAADQQAPENGPVTRILLDLTPIQFVPSLALGLLVQLNTRCRSRKQKLALAGVSTQVRKVFAVTRLDRVFEFVSDPNALAPP